MSSHRGGLAKLRHDVRTCANQILGYCELVREEADELQPSFVPDLDRIHAAGTRLLALLDGLLSEQPGKGEATAGLTTSPSEVRDALSGRILVVDDTEANRDILARRLQKQGLDVSVAADGAEALERIEQERFDLVLLDVMMPGIGGIEVLTTIRRRFDAGELPVIMVTARDASEEIVEAFRLGASDYITKPIDFAAALARVRTQLSMKRANDQNRALIDELEIRNRFIRRTFGRYLSDEVVSNLLDEKSGLELGGEKRCITILMSDIRGFSAVAERLEPQKVVLLLNHFFDVMTGIIGDHGGTIDEFLGDALLVFFGAPEKRADHALAAVRCAVAMQSAIDDVNRWNREAGLPKIEIGIGIHTGDVIVGNIGCERRAKYGAVGTNVNLTSRIESLTTGGQIMISDSTYTSVSGSVVVGNTLTFEPKGYARPVTVVEVTGSTERHLARAADDLLTTLATPLPVELMVIEEKSARGDAIAGELVRLSPKRAEVRASRPIRTMSDVRLRLAGNGTTSGTHFYAKVDAGGADDRCLSITFTSLPPDVALELEQLL